MHAYNNLPTLKSQNIERGRSILVFQFKSLNIDTITADFERLDKDGDGRLNSTEFIRFINNFVQVTNKQVFGCRLTYTQEEIKSMYECFNKLSKQDGISLQEMLDVQKYGARYFIEKGY